MKIANESQCNAPAAAHLSDSAANLRECLADCAQCTDAAAGAELGGVLWYKRRGGGGGHFIIKKWPAPPDLELMCLRGWV